MPEMNGWQVLEELKKKAPQVVIMTGYVPQEGESILFDRKADGYLIKPIDSTRLETMLRALLFPQNLGVFFSPRLVFGCTKADSGDQTALILADFMKGNFFRRPQRRKFALCNSGARTPTSTAASHASFRRSTSSLRSKKRTYLMC